MGKWTQLTDMHSGGRAKEGFEKLFIELPKDKAVEYFKVKFGHDPDNVTCTCCGSDYSVYDEESLEDATKYDRCGWKGEKNLSLEDLKKDPKYLFIDNETIVKEMADHWKA